MVPEIQDAMERFFVILGRFLHFDTPNNPKNQNFEKMNKITRNIIVLHDHIMYGSCDMELLRSFWAIFFSFTPLTTLRYYPFTHLCHK